MAEFGEKYPEAIKTRRLFGLFPIRFWEYRCVYTNAEIELMCADRSRIKYSSPPQTKIKSKKPSRQAINQTIKAWNERKMKEAEEAAKKQNQLT